MAELKYGQARCSCRKVYTAAHGRPGPRGQVVCPDCHRNHVELVELNQRRRTAAASTPPRPVFGRRFR